ncbi:MAG TPA: hypothetical protein VIE43_21000 [Thermoanaerobaculia bacterium]|jgi:hypothetical protein|nr:hypothetical protein [Thermoanaerobaculia bacterium]
MKKTMRKLQLSRETLRLLVTTDLKGADGGAATGGESFDPTCQSRCYVCPETWPVLTVDSPTE